MNEDLGDTTYAIYKEVEKRKEIQGRITSPSPENKESNMLQGSSSGNKIGYRAVQMQS